MVKDTITALRPKLKLFNSYEEAEKVVEELEDELRRKLSKNYKRAILLYLSIVEL